MTAPRAPAIVARDVHRAFSTGSVRQDVLKGISIDIHAGELTLIMGPSGSGKTTLLAILSGLLKPDSGTIEALGIALTALAPARLERFRLDYCGFVFQGFNLFAALTAIEQVELVLKYIGVDAADARARSERALAEVDLTPQAQLRPTALSGGQKQRVAIARALVKDPRLIFADEPTSNLDSVSGGSVIALLHRAAHARNAAVIVVTHDHRLLPHADRVIHLEDGRITRDERRQPAAADPEPTHA
jgi:putative ABC transport system ATP-binding protein